jgi:hypothetical protein
MKSRTGVLPDSIWLLIENGAQVKKVPYDDFYPLRDSSNAEMNLRCSEKPFLAVKAFAASVFPVLVLEVPETCRWTSPG